MPELADTVAAAAADPHGPRRGIAAWADWYVGMGVLDSVEPGGVDRYASASGRPFAVSSAVPDLPAAPALPLPAPTVPAEADGVATARAVAAACGSLAELEAALARLELCPLAETATRLCFADGRPDAPLMLVGEAPGAEEDRQGRPFSGPSGRLLDRMLAAAGLSREDDAYLTNVVYWRPPGNRAPTSSEIATCLPFLERQVELLRPRVLVSVGGVAARVLLDLKDGVGRLRGRRFLYQPGDGGPAVPTFVMFHPAYLLRMPLQKRLAWRDMLLIRAELREAGR